MVKAVWAVRTALRRDREGILEVVEEAFTGPDHDGREEVQIVVDTWDSGAGIDGLELVAVQDSAIVGHVLGARGDLEGTDVVAVAPLSVGPACQGRGVGTTLMTDLIGRAEAQGWPLIVLLGNPAYYERFGFEHAGRLGIVYRPVGEDSPNFMARRLCSFDPSLRGDFVYCWEKGGG